MEGYLLVDKPKDWTSFDVVGFVRRKVANVSGIAPKKIKVGHSGTLDPFATGLLVILVGKAYTKQAVTLLKNDKKYRVNMQLDAVSTTGDPEGIITRNNKPTAAPNIITIKEAMDKMIGEIDQVPPVYSAIKVNGVRAYQLARNNQPVVIEARKVKIHSLNLIAYNYPEVIFETEVSSGTYIRTLVEDLAKTFERTAYTMELRRTSIGKYSISDAVKAEAINEYNIASLLKKDLALTS